MRFRALVLAGVVALPVFAAPLTSPFGLVAESSPALAYTLPNGTVLKPIFRADATHYVAFAGALLTCVSIGPGGWPEALNENDGITRMSFGASLFRVEFTPVLRVTPMVCGQALGTPVTITTTPDVFTNGEPLGAFATTLDGKVITSTARHVISIDPVMGTATRFVSSDELDLWLLDPTQRQRRAMGAIALEHPALLVTPDGALWLHTRLYRTGANKITEREWVLRIGNDGVRSIAFTEATALMLVSPTTSPRLMWNAQLDAVVLSPLTLPARLFGTTTWAAIIPTHAPFTLNRFSLDRLNGATVDTLVGSPSGTFELMTPAGLIEAGFDADLLDVDGDRLTRTEELALGTSDFDRDSDGDGVFDHLELRFFGTDARDAGSAPTIAVPRQHYALSTALTEWDWLRLGGDDLTPATTGAAFCDGFEPTDCSAVTCTSFKRFSCRDAKGELTSQNTIRGIPTFTANADSWWSVSDAGLATADVTSETPVVHGHFGAVASLSLAAPSWAVITQPRGVTRVSTDAGTFAFYDFTRPCELMGSSSDTCASGQFSVPGIDGVSAIGRDETRGIVFVEGSSQYARPIYALSASGAVFVFDSLWLGDNSIGSIERAAQEDSYFTATGRSVDLAFNARSQRTTLAAPRANPWFTHGFSVRATTTFRVPAEPPPVRCVNAGGIFVCDSSAPDETVQPILGISVHSQWVPVADDALLPGDVLFWANNAQSIELATEVERPAIWRHTETGGTESWLADFRPFAAGDVAALATIDQQPIRGVGQLAFSPDATELCLTDDAKRAWVLSLTAGRPTALRLSRSSGALACQFDAQGHLAVLTESAIELEGAGSLTTGVTTGVHLARIADTWIVHAVGEPTACITTTGVRQRPAVSALFAGNDAVYFIDAKGLAGAATLERFCSGGLDERLSEFPDLWLATFNPLNTKYGVEVTRGSLAVRPDGTMLYGSLGALRLRSNGAVKDPQAMNNFLWRLRPTFIPERAPGLPQHELWRRNASKRTLVHTEVKQISAMAVVPGTVPPRWGARVDSEFMGLTPTAYVPPIHNDPLDGGTEPEPEPMTPEPQPMGCGCSSGAGALSILIALLAKRRRRSGQR